MSWHADVELVEGYVRGEVDDARAFSLEAHLLACDSCRSLVGAAVGSERLSASWAEIERAVDAPRRGPVERVLSKLRVPAHLARLLAATPSLRVSWVGAAAGALAFAALAAHSAHGQRALLLFLILAPLLPVAGVAAAYGPGVDPTHELVASSPLGAFRLLLIRASAVLATTLLVTGAVALALPRLDPIAAAWLLPALGLSVASLAVATFLPAISAAGSVSAVWVLGVLASEVWADGGIDAFLSPGPIRSVVFHAGGQTTFFVLAFVSALVVSVRRDRFELRSPA